MQYSGCPQIPFKTGLARISLKDFCFQIQILKYVDLQLSRVTHPENIFRNFDFLFFAHLLFYIILKQCRLLRANRASQRCSRCFS